MSRSKPEMPAGKTGLPNGVVSELSEGLRDDLVAVVLFGSRARREAHEGSDWDVWRSLPNFSVRTLISRRTVVMRREYAHSGNFSMRKTLARHSIAGEAVALADQLVRKISP